MIEIDLSGQEKVFAEATVTPAMTAQVSRNADSLTVTFCGQPGMGVAVETASAVEGPWNPLNAVELDSDGAGSVTLDVRVGESARFYRW